MAEENTTKIRKTKYIYNDLFSSDFFDKFNENDVENVELNLNLTSDEQEEEEV